MGFQTLDRIRAWHLSPPEKAVLMALALHLNEDSGQCFPSIPRLAETTCLHRATVIRCIASLRKSGAIKTTTGARGSYQYTIAHSFTGRTVRPVAHDDGSQSATGRSPQHDRSQPATSPVAACDPNRNEYELNRKAEPRSAQQETAPAGDGVTLDLFADDLAQPPAPTNPQAKTTTDAVDKVGPVFATKSGPWRPTQALIEKEAAAHPDLDLDHELAKAAAWCEANPAKRKTGKGMPRFINTWMNNARPVAAESSHDLAGFRPNDRLALTMEVQ
jgi:hypothetical protein